MVICDAIDVDPRILRKKQRNQGIDMMITGHTHHQDLLVTQNQLSHGQLGRVVFSKLHAHTGMPMLETKRSNSN